LNSCYAKGQAKLFELTDPGGFVEPVSLGGAIGGFVEPVSLGGATANVSIVTLSIHTAPSRSGGEGGNIGMLIGLYR
jgi:hypothetical protein